MFYENAFQTTFEVLLLCPMLTVSDEVKPPWIVQMIFKYVVAHLPLGRTILDKRNYYVSHPESLICRVLNLGNCQFGLLAWDLTLFFICLADGARNLQVSYLACESGERLGN